MMNKDEDLICNKNKTNQKIYVDNYVKIMLRKVDVKQVKTRITVYTAPFTPHFLCSKA